jgi:acetyl-CoA acetyltransferase
MSFQGVNSIELGAATVRKFLEMRNYTPDIFDGCVVGSTVSQPAWFHAGQWFCALMGNDKIGGPMISQACATSATCVYTAAAWIETGTHSTVLAAATDRCSNSTHSSWANPLGSSGEVISENWMTDNFTDPYAGYEMVQTAEFVAAEFGGISKEESDAMAIRRYEQYAMSLENDREFQKGYMIPVEVAITRKNTIVVDADEGVRPNTPEGLAPLKPTVPDGCITFGAQTHPADGNAGLIVTTKEKAAELSKDKNITIQLLSYGCARAKKARMAAAVTPAAQMALRNAGIEVKDLAAVKTHNPFTINDIVMGSLMNIPEDIFNNYGSSLIYGHPQGPTGARCTVELIEELVKLGGGYGLFAGCAAGDNAAALVLKVS